MLLQIYIGNINQIVHYGIDGQACRGVYLQLGCNVAAVCGYRMDGQEQVIGNLFV